MSIWSKLIIVGYGQGRYSHAWIRKVKPQGLIISIRVNKCMHVKPCGLPHPEPMEWLHTTRVGPRISLK